MNEIINFLLSAQKAAQVQHWNTKSFALHLALGELYDILVEYADELAEMHIGITGEIIKLVLPVESEFSSMTSQEFIKMILDELNSRTDIADLGMKNTYEELIGKIQRVKYKIDQLK